MWGTEVRYQMCYRCGTHPDGLGLSLCCHDHLETVGTDRKHSWKDRKNRLDDRKYINKHMKYS
ncbi:unnamed protein product [Boreogadus saida]